MNLKQRNKHSKLVLIVVLGLLVLGIGAQTIDQVRAAPLRVPGELSPRVFLPLVLNNATPPQSVTPEPTAVPTTISTPAPTPPPSSFQWAMLAANPQRTSWTPEEVRGNLQVEWYHPIEPYIPYKVQPIAANGNLYISTARGLYTFRAGDGALLWVYPTELPLGHSPTIATINETSIAYVGGHDHMVHAVDALTGYPVSGYTPYQAGAGFETNPLVIDDSFVSDTILAGNRDGYFYALDAVTGALKWRYKTDGPILFSAAYKNGIVYFASNDLYAYALNAADGSLVWKSEKFQYSAGFHSFWPVIYTNKLTGKDYVIFSGAENYRQRDNALTDLEPEYFVPGCRNIPGHTCPPGLIWQSSTANNDPYFANGTVLMDVNGSALAPGITTYFENSPQRHLIFVLNAANGREFTFDSNGNGKPEFAPITWSGGVTQAGNKFPPVINGIDGIYYQDTIYWGGGWIPRGDPVGWKFGDHFVSRVSGGSHAVDEPMAYSSGGKLIYWALCCDREAGAFDVTRPYSQSGRSWDYFDTGGNSLLSKAPDYQPMYNDGDSALYTDSTGWQIYSGKNKSKNGVYGKHGTTQSPPIPYQGKVYLLKGNTLIAFSPSAGSPTKLALATIVPTQNAPAPPTSAELKQRLEVQVQKMLDAGHLRPGYTSAGFIDLYSGAYTDGRDFGEIFDYFQNPSDTVVTLISALPYLSPNLQAQVKTYLQTNYGPGAPYSFTNIVHVGWNSGAPREAFDIPPDIWTSSYLNFTKRTTPVCGGCGYWKNFPPYSFYAAWKYAQVFGNPQPIFDSIKAKIEAPPGDTYLVEKPYMLNLYLAGYRGYLELEKLSGYPESATVRGWYNHLLDLRVNNFSKDTPSTNHFWTNHNYYRALSVARNFMFLTPEVADQLNQHTKAQVQQAVNEYNYVAPYWFVSRFDNDMGEGTFQQLYDPPAMFQAKAYILKEPYTELVKWLDVPAFATGDLFYIQNLVAALSAP